MLIYLIGFMGSGKTTVGKRLAKKAGYAFVDLDKLIEQSENKSINEIFELKGEDYFRQTERYVLQTTFKLTNTIISCGGGTPCFFENMDLMNQYGITVYLQMSATSLLSRLNNSKQQRPLFKANSNEEKFEFINEKLKEREPYYKRAKIIVDGLSVDVDGLMEKLTGRGK